MSESKVSKGFDHGKLQQLVHDMRTQLLIIGMGLDSAEQLAAGRPRLEALLERMRREGLEPLRGKVDALSELAEDPPAQKRADAGHA